MNMESLKTYVKKGKDAVLNTPEIERKVKDATSNDKWGPTGTQMQEISRESYRYECFPIIMGVIWKRINDPGKYWRHVYKSLLLIDYLVKNGSAQVIRDCRHHTMEIKTLVEFQYIEDEKDVGLSVRERAKQVIELLHDDKRIKEERDKAKANQNKYVGIGNDGGYDSYSGDNRGYGGGGARGGYGGDSPYGGGGNRDSPYGGSGARDSPYGGSGRDNNYGGSRDSPYGGGGNRDSPYGGSGARDSPYGSSRNEDDHNPYIYGYDNPEENQNGGAFGNGGNTRDNNNNDRYNNDRFGDRDNDRFGSGNGSRSNNGNNSSRQQQQQQMDFDDQPPVTKSRPRAASGGNLSTPPIRGGNEPQLIDFSEPAPVVKAPIVFDPIMDGNSSSGGGNQFGGGQQNQFGGGGQQNQFGQFQNGGSNSSFDAFGSNTQQQQLQFGGGGGQQNQFGGNQFGGGQQNQFGGGGQQNQFGQFQNTKDPFAKDEFGDFNTSNDFNPFDQPSGDFQSSKTSSQPSANSNDPWAKKDLFDLTNLGKGNQPTNPINSQGAKVRSTPARVATGPITSAGSTINQQPMMGGMNQRPMMGGMGNPQMGGMGNPQMGGMGNPQMGGMQGGMIQGGMMQSGGMQGGMMQGGMQGGMMQGGGMQGGMMQGGMNRPMGNPQMGGMGNPQMGNPQMAGGYRY
ncbi:epsin [Heterostelium album PN500]|uniref:Epsin n=1 Tax=Heterostelium pallidum (strain ATCC 26659 / Pp 5 / PN500) TaxID=670386 RepID=D3BQV6_HETP5|nr:epsin [Heterostelium album PN500]EFA76526.1 epsin [Heterostelium album PN500]|eukprot:XP_020428658.1 epsin [Heterostelium album PN500]